MSDFDRLAATVVAPALMEHFGERDGNGDFAKLKYYPPNLPAGNPPLEWRAILSAIRFQDAPDFDGGGLTRLETRTCQVERSATDAGNVRGFQHNATIEDKDGRWTLDEATTVWGEAMVTLGLVRVPLVRKGEPRAAVRS